jgi:hypothetical protein
MNERGLITATMHELERIKVIQALPSADSSKGVPPSAWA